MEKMKVVGIKKDREVTYLKVKLFKGIHNTLCSFLRNLNLSSDEILKIDTTLDCMSDYSYLKNDNYEIHVIVPSMIPQDFMYIIIKPRLKTELINTYFENAFGDEVKL